MITLNFIDMKKIYFAIAALVAMLFATEANAQLTVGAGYNHEVMTEKVLGDSESEGLDGFYLEATYDLDFLDEYWGMLALQPGVKFSYAAEIESEEFMGMTMKSTFAETYFNIPVLLKYSYPIGDLKLSAFAGPVLSLGLTSSAKLTVRGDDGKYTTKYNLYNGKTTTQGDDLGLDSSLDSTISDYGRFDLKLGLGIGATIADVIGVKLGYDIGLLNKYTGEQYEGETYKVHTGVFYVGVGISF